MIFNVLPNLSLHFPMIIKHQLEALKRIADAVSLDDDPQSLILYSTAVIIHRELDNSLERIPREDQPSSTDHMRGRLAGFIEKLNFAVMPCEGSDIGPQEWLSRAKDDLIVARSDAHTGFD